MPGRRLPNSGRRAPLSRTTLFAVAAGTVDDTIDPQGRARRRGGDGQPPVGISPAGTAAHSSAARIRAQRRHRRTDAAGRRSRRQPPAWAVSVASAGGCFMTTSRSRWSCSACPGWMCARAQLPAIVARRVCASTLVFLLVVVPALFANAVCRVGLASSSSPPPSEHIAAGSRRRLRAPRCRRPRAAADRLPSANAATDSRHGPGGGFGEQQHRPDQRTPPEPRVERSRRHIGLKSWVLPSTSSLRALRSPAKRNWSCGGSSVCVSPSSNTMRSPLPDSGTSSRSMPGTRKTPHRVRSRRSTAASPSRRRRDARSRGSSRAVLPAHALVFVGGMTGIAFAECRPGAVYAN